MEAITAIQTEIQEVKADILALRSLIETDEKCWTSEQKREHGDSAQAVRRLPLLKILLIEKEILLTKQKTLFTKNEILLREEKLVATVQRRFFVEDGSPPAKRPHISTNTSIASDITIRGRLFRDNVNDSVFSEYMAVAEGLREDEHLQTIVQAIQDIPRNLDDAYTPFVFLEGSSGTGKTQTAFALMNKLQLENTQVLYVLYTTPTAQSAQPIYKCFESVSRLFNSCINRDESVFQSPSCGSLRELELHTFGFILQFLLTCNTGNHMKSGDIVEIKAVKGIEIINHLATNYTERKYPVIIIDECVIAVDEKRFRFVRNLRSVGLRVILLGTDSRISELLDSSSHGSRSGPLHTWCHVFNRLPNLWVPSLRLPVSISPHLHRIIAHSRPWFASIASEYLRNLPSGSIPDLDSVIQIVFHRIRTEKLVFHNPAGRRSQICMFLNKSFSGTECSALIFSHFAELQGLENFTLDTNLRKLGSESVWTQVVEFPSIERDVLLYLAMMGGRFTNGFMFEDEKVPFLWFFKECLKSSEARKMIIDTGNLDQTANDGTLLESIMTTCICLASHSGGVNGTSINDFIKSLIFNLSQNRTPPIDTLNLDFSCFPLLPLQNFHVPFLSPPGLQWPTWLTESVSGVIIGNFANLSRPKNASKIDVSSTCKISAESKDYGLALQKIPLINIVDRIPLDSKLHIVFVRSLQNEYFTNACYEDEVGEVSKRVILCKVDSSANPPTISNILGIPFPPHPTCVVLFVICPR